MGIFTSDEEVNVYASQIVENSSVLMITCTKSLRSSRSWYLSKSQKESCGSRSDNHSAEI